MEWGKSGQIRLQFFFSEENIHKNARPLKWAAEEEEETSTIEGVKSEW